MIDAGINAIVDLARKASSQVIECKQEPEGTYYVRQGNGELVKTRADVAPRRHVVHDIETIVQLANRFKEAASVWHNFDGVTVLVDDNARNESARLALKPSKQFETLLTEGRCAMVKPRDRPSIRDRFERFHTEELPCFASVAHYDAEEAAEMERRDYAAILNFQQEGY